MLQSRSVRTRARLTSYDKLFRLRIGVVTRLRDYYRTNAVYVVASPRGETANNKTGGRARI